MRQAAGSTKKEEGKRHPLISRITQIEKEKRRTWNVGRRGQREFLDRMRREGWDALHPTFHASQSLPAVSSSSL